MQIADAGSPLCVYTQFCAVSPNWCSRKTQDAYGSTYFQCKLEGDKTPIGPRHPDSRAGVDRPVAAEKETLSRILVKVYRMMAPPGPAAK